ncbi:MAG TPA: ElyC/SanA/YdcF family protein, partial [Bryobacteraceae bacterium]|nr:ElyC/SanA/YdcF family protein [Bryobacteraceae bacterium]
SLLVLDQAPATAEAALVLAGDGTGERVLKGCDLLRSGVVPLVLVSGPVNLSFYGINEADAAIRFAAAKGCDSARLQPLYVRAFSTRDEAIAVLNELRRRGIRRLLLVTSSSHTARATRTFRKYFGDSIDLRSVAAPQQYFTPDTWWHTREGQKTVFFELSKTIASAVGM